MTNVLFMTATPIPRTLAISVFGEMDVSSIKQLPKGRKPIITSWAKHEQYEQVLTQMTSELKKEDRHMLFVRLLRARNI